MLMAEILTFSMEVRSVRMPNSTDARGREVRAAIKRMNSGKSSGMEAVRNEDVEIRKGKQKSG